MTKYIFVTGGVVSSLGKGIAAASIGRLLKSRGLSVSVLKFDPYINIDPGTMSPYQHGEVFVTDDGAETDLDLGHYERFIDIDLTGDSSVTTGKIYWSVLTKERKGEYLGNTVQVIPHVTNEIKERIHKVQERSQADVIIIEIGGTIGDIESLPFLEAIRQFRSEEPQGNVLNLHVALVPYLKVSGEAKTKPVQHSVKELRGLGIKPDIILCRTEVRLTKEETNKIALFCDVEPSSVVQALDADSIYDVPLNFEEEGIGQLVVNKLGLSCKAPDLSSWSTMVERLSNPESEIKVAVVGKYSDLKDAYISIAESLKHAGATHRTHIDIEWVKAEEMEIEGSGVLLRNANAILAPGGFGDRGVEGIINSIKYARENRIPFFGICLGMQLAVVEFARNVLGIEDAHSSEFGTFSNPVIDLMEDQEGIEDKGGTMRLGAYPCFVTPETNASKAYDSFLIEERHRHRYELNNKYRDQFIETGMVIAGASPDNRLVEIVEVQEHPWFVAAQYHPELKSRPYRPHPLFEGFVKAGIKHAKSKEWLH
ncbi:CTP synthase [Bacillus atrophaeus]|uniref:CTP synthase n=1 Tax=Bacillus atrophaeus TaxID=1452 RepID=UPI002E1FE9CD|nr:CTP synthase [Bacillus atrophaeus]